ncbi:hypothetical protein [Leucobacter sp. OH1287]|uniref:hypothetical protein n=1 Tax=Leucobacter sp. OH1287 TaxID=2491049 RepID=UPI000F5F8460|nr:hypothetical protein [Leucobacter sp. OH1287]RRD61658.1 hypothetical protein EII30_02185 [Leucobacter sp. OH1287]
MHRLKQIGIDDNRVINFMIAMQDLDRETVVSTYLSSKRSNLKRLLQDNMDRREAAEVIKAKIAAVESDYQRSKTFQTGMLGTAIHNLKRCAVEEARNPGSRDEALAIARKAESIIQNRLKGEG